MQKTNGKKYFGITSQKPKDRWDKGKGYKKNQYFWRAINKYGWFDGFDHEIITNCLTEPEASEMEIKLIAQYDTTNPQNGYNINPGGQGGKHSEESKKRMRENHADFSGEKHPLYGRGHTQETREKMSQIAKERYKNEAYIRKMSESHKWENLSQEAKLNYKKAAEERGKRYCGVNNPCWGVGDAVVQFDSSYHFLNIFITVRDAQRQTQIDRSSITKCCNNKAKSAGKHPHTDEPLKWKYVYDKIQKDGTIIQGAITLGYITQNQVNEYLNNLKQKGTDT